MKKIKIVARVGKVYAPKKISVFINNLDNDLYDKHYESQKSFDQEFEASSGRYIINVIGMNQEDDTTTVTVSGDFVIATTKSSNKGNYVMVFIGNVN
ncbi:hypothetical protein EV143_10334 [Flavobacterium chryseum]|uniref:hypothetical protein n=1 Tax=Flavobacterium sp. P3160 TaxID=2512113 RepID=UPI00105C9DFC|nr:hypothetical protein [Flavobacterium sp. P3160]TDO77802.1 hypothetical protein EV143_10334 [Flavobacterium sp. P3160]